MNTFHVLLGITEVIIITGFHTITSNSIAPFWRKEAIVVETCLNTNFSIVLFKGCIGTSGICAFLSGIVSEIIVSAAPSSALKSKRICIVIVRTVRGNHAKPTFRISIDSIRIGAIYDA